MRKTLRTLLVPIGAIVALAVPASASAAFELATPLEGSRTTANVVPTSWAGACDPGLTCKLFSVAYSRTADVDPATGRLVERASTDYDLDPYKTAYPESDAATSTSSPTLNPTTWYAQLQWRQCDASYNCSDQQTAVRTFTVAHSLTRLGIKASLRLRLIRSMWFDYTYKGNAPVYRAQALVSVQKQRRNGKRYWAIVKRGPVEKAYGQTGKVSKRSYNFRPGRTVRAGARIRVQIAFTAPGMARRVTTLTTTSV